MSSRKVNSILIISVLILTLVACGSALYYPTTNHAANEENLKELQQGRALYINKCSGCHSLILPEKYKANEWKDWVDKMESKSKMTPEEKELIVKYLAKGSKN